MVISINATEQPGLVGEQQLPIGVRHLSDSGLVFGSLCFVLFVLKSTKTSEEDYAPERMQENKKPSTGGRGRGSAEHQ